MTLITTERQTVLRTKNSSPTQPGVALRMFANLTLKYSQQQVSHQRWIWGFTQARMYANSSPGLWNAGQISPKAQNRDISGPTKRTYVLQKFSKNTNKNNLILKDEIKYEPRLRTIPFFLSNQVTKHRPSTYSCFPTLYWIPPKNLTRTSQAWLSVTESFSVSLADSSLFTIVAPY